MDNNPVSEGVVVGVEASRLGGSEPFALARRPSPLASHPPSPLSDHVIRTAGLNPLVPLSPF